MECNYCKNQAEWVDNSEIYGKSYGKSHMAWLCRPCNAYVGCHNNSKKPLGTLANYELRELRKKAKNLWIKQELGSWEVNQKAKKKAYLELRKMFKKEFHFGSSTKEECEIIIKELTSKE